MDERTLTRFMGKIEIQPNGCWHHSGKRNLQGYAYFWLDGKSRLAHRVSYEHFVGSIPEDASLDHLCHTRDTSCPGGDTDLHRRCVNPEHLEPVSTYENIMRGRGPGAENAVKQECKYGHPFTPENTYFYPNGERCCRTCQSAAVAEWRRINRPASGPHCRDKTHCPQGHPYDDANTYVSPKGTRSCRACRRKTDREAKRAKRAREKAAGSAA